MKNIAKIYQILGVFRFLNVFTYNIFAFQYKLFNLTVFSYFGSTAFIALLVYHFAPSVFFYVKLVQFKNFSIFLCFPVLVESNLSRRIFKK